MSLHQLYVALLIGGLVLLASIAATRLATGAGLPSLLLFLGVGVLVGESGLGLDFDNAQLAQDLGTAALAVILVEGGLTTRFGDVRKALAPAGVLATVGVGVSTWPPRPPCTGCSGCPGSWRCCWARSCRVPMPRRCSRSCGWCRCPRRLSGLLEAESGFNDAPAVILVLLFSTTPLVLEPGAIAATLLYELAIGTVIGLGFGFLGAMTLRRIALPAAGLYPLATFGLGMVAFAAAGSAHASGFLAAYLAGVVLANSACRTARRPGRSPRGPAGWPRSASS